MGIFLNISPKRAQRGKFFNIIEQSFIFRLNDDFHQPRPQYALRTIAHTTLYLNHNSLIVLNNLLRTSARSAEVVLTTALILLTKFLLKQAPSKVCVDKIGPRPRGIRCVDKIQISAARHSRLDKIPTSAAPKSLCR